ncbi:MAG: hypothetical protein FJ109_16600, partial [Deltaproteobacteria bacterium]|nr:hypothetical protein [Deltaproteobacteria bacterium]
MMLRRLWPLALCSVLFVAGCPSPTPRLSSGPALSDKELEALEAVQLAWDTSRAQGSQLWPGFLLHEVPLLIFRPGNRSFAVNPGFDPELATRISDPRFSEVVWMLDSKALPYSAGLPFARDVEWQGHRFFLVRHTDGSERKSWFRLVVHEIFHEWQQSWRPAQFPEACRYPYGDGQNAFAARAEEMMLARMMVPARPEELDGPLAEYLAVRSSRYRSGAGGAAADAAAIEDWEERIEGTARYVEEAYAVAAHLAAPSAAAEELVRYFKTFRPGDLQKWKYYRVGLALGRLLDLLEDTDWKDACREGQSPFRYALGLLADETAEKVASVPTVLARYQGERQAVEDSLAAYLATEQELIDTWKGEGPVRVELVLPAGGRNAYYSNRGPTIQLPDCHRLATGVTAYVDITHGLEILARGVATRNGPQLARVVFHADIESAVVHLDGEKVAPDDMDRPFQRSIVIQGTGWKLDSRG